MASTLVTSTLLPWSFCRWSQCQVWGYNDRRYKIELGLQVITSAQGNIYRCVTTEYYNNETRVQRNNKALCDKCECGSKWWIIMHIGNDNKVMRYRKYAYVNDEHTTGLITHTHAPWPPAGLTTAWTTTTLAFRGTPLPPKCTTTQLPGFSSGFHLVHGGVLTL